MNRLYYVFVCLLLLTQSYAQSVTITPGTASPAIEAKTTANGVKIPMMGTYQRQNISNPTMGLMVFDTDLKALFLYNGSSWMRLAVVAENAPSVIEIAQKREIFDTDGTTSFGASIAYSSGFLIVGDPDQNQVTIWKNSNNGYVVDTVLVPTQNIQSGDALFGKSVAMEYYNSEYYLAIGHPKKKYNVTSYPDHGTVHIYKLVNNKWTYQTSIYPPGATTGDQFGYSVDFANPSGSLLSLWVGAPFDDLDSSPNTVDVGSVYVYTKNPSDIFWTPKHKFQDAAANTGNKMGLCISADSDEYGAAGAPGNNGERGAIYAYKYNSGTTNYSLLSKIIPTDVAAGDKFGSSVYVYGTKMLGGSPYATVSGNLNQGKAYGFDLSYNANNYDQVIYTDPNGHESEFYGYSVALSNNIMAIAAPYKTINNIRYSGAVFYKYSWFTFGDDRIITEQTASYNAKFGQALVVTPSKEVVVSSLGGRPKKGQISIIQLY